MSTENFSKSGQNDENGGAFIILSVENAQKHN